MYVERNEKKKTPKQKNRSRMTFWKVINLTTVYKFI